MNFTQLVWWILIHRLSLKGRDGISPLCCHFLLNSMQFSCFQFLKTILSQLSVCWHLLVSECRAAWGQLEISIAPFWSGAQLLVIARRAGLIRRQLKAMWVAFLLDTLHFHNIMDNKIKAFLNILDIKPITIPSPQQQEIWIFMERQNEKIKSI